MRPFTCRTAPYRPRFSATVCWSTNVSCDLDQFGHTALRVTVNSGPRGTCAREMVDTPRSRKAETVPRSVAERPVRLVDISNNSLFRRGAWISAIRLNIIRPTLKLRRKPPSGACATQRREAMWSLLCAPVPIPVGGKISLD
ncbi:unnamed protein product, partial [Scytosiphon promiscuus]